MIADSHIHLAHFSFQGNFPYLNFDGSGFRLEVSGTRDLLIERMKSADIAFCVEPAIELDSNEQILALSQSLAGFHYPAVGVHPTRTFQYMVVDKNGQKRTKQLRLRDFQKLKQYAENPAAVANRIAELKGITQEEVECITTENAMRLFHIGK